MWCIMYNLSYDWSSLLNNRHHKAYPQDTIGNEAMHSSQWIRDISGSLSLQALRQYIPLWSHLQVLQLQTGTADHFIWKWSPEPVVISALRTYHVFFNGQCGVLGATILRKVHVPSPPPPTISCSSGLCYLTGAGPRIAYNDTTSRTAGRVLCVQKHRRLCNTCYSIVFSREVWFTMLHRPGLHALTPSLAVSIPDWWLNSRRRFIKAEHRGYDSLVVLISWLIWKECNAQIFNNLSSLLAHLATMSDVVCEWISLLEKWFILVPTIFMVLPNNFNRHKK
jgi:hypothetical protein